MGNIHALRDWGHAKDYVEMQWMMLQQDKPKDYVIASGQQHSVKDFIIWTANEIGIELSFQGEGENEIGVVTSISGGNAPAISKGDVILRIDPKYYRPTEVETLLGDPSKAKKDLGWSPKISAKELCIEMTRSDLKSAKKCIFKRKRV